MSNTSPPRAPLPIWWALWFAMQSGLFVAYFFLSKPSAGNAPTTPALLVVPAGQLLASAVLRWVLLPKMTDAQKAFPLFVVGMALAEGACFTGLFLVPAYQQELFIASLLGVGQFLPLFAAKFNEPPRP
jgi:hypothetical protein